MENTLFNQHRMDKYAKDNSFKIKPSQHDLIKKHIEKLRKGELKAETSNYLYFFDVVLRDILGYDREENVLFDETVDKGAKRSEFVLKSGDEKFMIVELKGQNVDLDTHQKGHNNQTPVEQAREYSLKTKSANWIMVSNYDEFRLYHWDKKDDYISFKAEELLDKEKFGYFMLSFSKRSHLKENYADKLLKESLVVENDIETDFYKLFHETRLMLIKELEDTNGFDTPKAVHYSQSILNRYMFICFAEDINNLLPSEISTETIYVPIMERNISERTIWNRLNELFGFINKGNEYKGVNRYNGGLFKESFDFITIRDIVEDPNYFKDQRQKWDLKEYSLKINELMGPYGKKINPIYWNLLTISSINFESDLDVNILGHIFENSIGDLEDLKERSKGRRKKDGIFYTPAYITEYICKNTIIPYLSKSGKPTEVKDLINEYWGSDIHELDEKVKKIKIVDPACGSGAFLNKAADILVEIHEEIHQTLYKDDKTLAKFFDNVGERRKILKNNIYGVDLNEESVEITKLAMFLKVAQKDSALPDLDKNIKCGNSLIDDPKYAGENAFNWNKEFPEIFNEGGFDVVIGNPPWGAKLDNNEKKFINTHYKTPEYQINTYVVFMEKCKDLIVSNGLMGLIVPNGWLTMHYFKKIRKMLIEETSFQKVIVLKYNAFEDVTSESSILCTKKISPTETSLLSTAIIIEANKFEEMNLKEIDQKYWATNVDVGFNAFFNRIQTELVAKIYDKSKKHLNDYAEVKAGIKPYEIGKGTPKQTKKDVEDRIYDADVKINSDYLPYVVGGNIRKYTISTPRNQWIKYGICLAAPRKIDFNVKKIVVRRTSDRIMATIDYDGFLNLNSVFNIYLKKESVINYEYLLGILNSKLADFIYRYIAPDFGRVFSEVKGVNLDKIPIYEVNSENQVPLIKKVDILLQLNKDLQDEVTNFHSWLKRTFNIEKLSKKLEKYYELDFDEFLKEIKKKKVDIKPRKTQELLESEFNESLTVINPLLQQIKETDREIDEMVYDLYGLTDDEIKIVNDSLSSEGV